MRPLEANFNKLWWCYYFVNDLVMFHYKNVFQKDINLWLPEKLKHNFSWRDIWFFFPATTQEELSSPGSTDSSDNEKAEPTRHPRQDATLSSYVRDVCTNPDIRYLVGHPEDFLNDITMDAMKRAPWNRQVTHIIVDEAHCVVQWGDSFRTSYRDIENLRSLFTKSHPTFVAVTATATTAMQKDICRLLNMEGANVIVGETDRSNIKLCVKRRQSHAGRDRTAEASYTAVFMPLIKELKALQNEYPKTVVYTSLKWCGFANELRVRYMTDGRVESTGVPSISQYHAPLTSEVSWNYGHLQYCLEFWWLTDSFPLLIKAL